MTRRAVLLAAAAFVGAAPARAIIVDVRPSTTPVADAAVFPNWTSAEMASFDMLWCDSVSCPGATDATLRGLTVVNYGTAPAGAASIAAVYWRSTCAGDTGMVAMTYAGQYAVDGGTYPAWTWAGTMSLGADPCTSCGCTTPLHLYADIGSCPAPGDTVILGMATSGGGAVGGVSDAIGGIAPFVETRGAVKTMAQALAKADKAAAMPGDSVTYSLFYGRPGSATLASITLMETLPSYMHYVAGSAAPAPDPGWDPDPGPPARLRWTLAGPLTPVGGITGLVTFMATVDWGNEPFDPGSGTTAAPDGIVLQNNLQAAFAGGSCVPAATVAAAPPVSVGRFAMWMEADSDAAFASVPGLAADALTYSLSIVNRSTTRTLRGVTLWDSVPPELDAWASGCGILDPCVGQTMTPTGCAGAGITVNGGVSLLTWTFDLAPGASQTVRWKGLVKSNALPGNTITNIAGAAAGGATGVQGSGSSGPPVTSVHLAPVVDRRPQIGYTMLDANTSEVACDGWAINFYPLNAGADFELRAAEYSGPGFATTGGVSPSLGSLIGTCRGGFPGSGGVSGGGEPGCGAERSPARYVPAAWVGVCPTIPFAGLYKVTSTAPFLWEVMTQSTNNSYDSHFYVPTASSTMRGFTAYTYRRSSTLAGRGDSLNVINTSLDATGTYTPGLTTDVYVFKWEPTDRRWVYSTGMSLGAESQGTVMGTVTGEAGHYRIISTRAQIIVHQGFGSYSTLGNATPTYAALAPFRETGNNVSAVGSGNAYLVTSAAGTPGNMGTQILVGNVGAANATYNIWRYDPAVLGVAPVPQMLGGTTGAWHLMGAGNAPAGLAAAGNPAAYDTASHGPFAAPSSALFKVEVTAGGPVQVVHGDAVSSASSGGSFLDTVAGGPVGGEFWYHQAPMSAPAGELGAIAAFCPTQGTGVTVVSNDGYSSSYTTNGADQVVIFRALTDAAAGVHRNWKLTTTGGNALAMFSHGYIGEKAYAAPVVRGIPAYRLIAPPSAYAGQTFWLTVVVLNAVGATETTYTGVTSFTSTDPTAKIAGLAMDSYNYGWVGGDAGVKVFVGVVLTSLGVQNIVAEDTVDGSRTGVTTCMVVGADVKATAAPQLTIAASGDIAMFKICWSNYSTATASTYTVTDAIPNGTIYYPDTPSNHFCGATTGFGAATVAYSTTTDTPTAYATMTGPATTAVQYLKWTIPTVGVATTGCVCFKVTVQ